jgi:hypothetical protein
MSSQAYTPGLKRKESTIIRKARMLPVPGEVLIKEGEITNPETIIARTSVTGEKHLIKLSEKLGVYPEKVSQHMLKNIGETITENEIIAKKTSFFGLSKTEIKSPITGRIERISEITGEIIVSGVPVLVEINGYIPGKIEKIIPNEGALVLSRGTFLQGIFGIGGETYGELRILANNPDDIITDEEIDSDCESKILVCGSMITGKALVKAGKIGVKGVIVGGIMDEDLYSLLGYEIGVAITGNEDIGITLVIMEGFGEMSMSDRVFEILKRKEGQLASINGTTQIRAGVMRPEVIIAETEYVMEDIISEEEDSAQGLTINTNVRIIREPYFGSLGRVSSLPIELYQVESESEVRILEVELMKGEKVIVPRANVEIIEE